MYYFNNKMSKKDCFDSLELLECVNEIDSLNYDTKEKNISNELSNLDEKTTKKRIPRKKVIDKLCGKVDMEWVCIKDFTKELKFEKFNIANNFIHVCDIVEPKKEDNYNLICFKSIIDQEKWNDDKEWIYLFTINGYIVKIGGTRNGLKKRAQSYLCGYYTKNRGYPGKMSGTNATIYNTFAHFLKEGCEIKMYAYDIPIQTLKTKHFDIEIEIIAQTFHCVESIVIEKYKKSNGSLPFLCKNSDPNYRNE